MLRSLIWVKRAFPGKILELEEIINPCTGLAAGTRHHSLCPLLLMESHAPRSNAKSQRRWSPQCGAAGIAVTLQGFLAAPGVTSLPGSAVSKLFFFACPPAKGAANSSVTQGRHWHLWEVEAAWGDSGSALICPMPWGAGRPGTAFYWPLNATGKGR